MIPSEPDVMKTRPLAPPANSELHGADEASSIGTSLWSAGEPTVGRLNDRCASRPSKS
jgi:hypothetical protein